jgi:hypothetical protein
MTRAPLAVVLLAAASPALGFDLGNGLGLTGVIELEHARGETSESFLRGDATLSWRNSSAGTLGFGLDLTVDSIFILGENDDATSYWGGVVLTTGIGEITLGAARPVIDTVYSFPDFGTLSIYNVSFPPIARSFTTFFAAIEEDVLPGISLEGSAGALTYGASIHELQTFSGSARSSQIAVTYAIGDTTLLGGFETISASGMGNNVSIYRLGALHRMDRLTIGAELSSLDASTSPTTSLGLLYGAYDVTEALTVSGSLGVVDQSSGSETLWNLGAEYRFGNGGFLQGGVTSLGASDEIVDVGIGFRF